MGRFAVRLFVFGLAGVASGCSTFEAIESALLRPEFSARPATGAAAMPLYRVGDVFHFRVGDTLVKETVERIDGEGVWWRDNTGRRWIGGGGDIVPTRAIVDLDGKPRAANDVMESTGELFPITIGKSVAYRTSAQNSFKTTVTHNRSCSVEAFGAVKTVAGEFDAYRLKCSYDGAARNVYYAPSIGRVVLQTSDTIFDSVKRELIAFERGTGKPVSVAQEAAATAPMAKKKMRMTSTFQPAAGGNARYGVQLAAYRSPARAKRAWRRIKSKGGALLDKFAPTIESHGKGGAALFRLIVGDFSSKNKARAHCRALKRARIDCWPRARAANSGTPLAAAPAAPRGPRMVSR